MRLPKTQAHVADRPCEVSILVDAGNVADHHVHEAAVDDCALSREIGPHNLQRSLPTSVMLSSF